MAPFGIASAQNGHVFTSPDWRRFSSILGSTTNAASRPITGCQQKGKKEKPIEERPLLAATMPARMLNPNQITTNVMNDPMSCSYPSGWLYLYHPIYHPMVDLTMSVIR
jgi:hypothetical protein